MKNAHKLLSHTSQKVEICEMRGLHSLCPLMDMLQVKI